jgi:hypothetical protein
VLIKTGIEASCVRITCYQLMRVTVVADEGGSQSAMVHMQQPDRGLSAETGDQGMHQ